MAIHWQMGVWWSKLLAPISCTLAGVAARLNLAGVMVQRASSEHPGVAGFLMVLQGYPRGIMSWEKIAALS